MPRLRELHDKWTDRSDQEVHPVLPLFLPPCIVLDVSLVFLGFPKFGGSKERGQGMATRVMTFRENSPRPILHACGGCGEDFAGEANMSCF